MLILHFNLNFLPMTQPTPSFCAAPWVEGLVRPNGTFQTCCRNATSFGDWPQEGLQAVWHSARFQDFRKHIAAGEFPDEFCKMCYDNGTVRSLYHELVVPFQLNMRIVFDFLNTALPEITKIEKLFHLTHSNGEAADVLEQYFRCLDAMERRSGAGRRGVLRKIAGRGLYLVAASLDQARRHRRIGFALMKSGLLSLRGFLSGRTLAPATSEGVFHNALIKLRTIGTITASYLHADLTPSVVAPFRQVGLIYQCNARCIHCPGRFSGEITGGPELDKDLVDQAFSYPEGIIDFYMNGSEFLFYRDWKKIAARLVGNGTKLSISTNGILLTPATIQHLIDEQIIKSLNISIDGATKETVESIRRNVNFEKLIRSIDFLFSYATAKQYDFNLSFSFALMKNNYREFPKLVALVHELKSNRTHPPASVYCQALENAGIEGYGDFVRRHHHSLVARNELVSTFDEALKESQRTGIPTNAFYYIPIKDFVQQGYPFPPLAM
jgi:sulfatase maturation enzyme AslB (radical SAM superfamily)